MEPILLIVAVTYMVSGKYGKDTAQSAYKAGKEPPGLVKARLRHEAGGGRFRTRPGKDKTQPKGPGATRLLIASRWSVVCEKAKTKHQDKLQRWRAWYQEQAPQRDQVWRDKQQRKMTNRANRLDKWQSRWTSTKSAAAGAKDAVKTALSSDKDDATEQPAAENPTEAENPSTEQPANPEPELAGDTPAAEGQDEPASSDTGGSEQQHSTSAGGVMDHQQAATALRAAAARVEQYRTDLSQMADGLGGKQWGAEVHGQIRDMDSKLADISADYVDMANRMQQEGDNVADAEDAHPYVPGQHVVNA